MSAVMSAQAEDGWILFAAMMLFFSGGWNIIEGLVGFFRSTYFIGHAVFGDLWIWALIWLAFGVLEIAAAYAILGGRGWGRWFGIVIAGLSAYASMLAIATYPWWSIFLLSINVLILYALAVRWRRVNKNTTTS